MSDTPSSSAVPFESPSFEEPDDFEDADDLEDVDEDDDVEDDDDVDEDDDLDVVDDEDDLGNRVAGGSARAVLDHIARSIVDDPDAVVIDTGQDRQGLRLSLHVAPGDMGRVIGKRGRVAQAIRAVVRAAAARDGGDATVDIVD